MAKEVFFPPRWLFSVGYFFLPVADMCGSSQRVSFVLAVTHFAGVEAFGPATHYISVKIAVLKMGVLLDKTLLCCYYKENESSTQEG